MKVGGRCEICGKHAWLVTHQDHTVSCWDCLSKALAEKVGEKFKRGKTK